MVILFFKEKKVIFSAVFLLFTASVWSRPPGPPLVSGVFPSLQAFGIEFMITLVLVLVVFAAAADTNNTASVKGSAPLAIGLSITTCHLFAIPLTGSSMNPARSLGPSIVAGCWDNHWVYWAGPVMGGVTAALLYQLVFQAPPTPGYRGVQTEEKEDKV